MILIEGLSKGYASTPLFEGVSFTIGSRERIGLVGRNGHGKSTLLKIIAGIEEADSGTINTPKDYKLGFLKQNIAFEQSSILEVACEGIAEHSADVDLSYKAKSVLSGLGFLESQFSESPSTLSGGYQVRLSLAQILVSECNLLLLDEPTNYLDIISLRWLIRFLRSWPGELLLITHDRAFMDSVSTHTLGIHRQNVKKVQGSTTKFYELLATEEELHGKTLLNQKKKREETEEFIRRFRAKASKAKAVQSRIKALQREGALEELHNITSLEFKFPYADFPSKWALHAKNLSFAYPDMQTPLIEDLSFSVPAGERIAIIGKNGKGKTTLLRVLADQLSPTGGSVEMSSNSMLQFFGQTNVERLDPKATVEEEIAEANSELSRTAVRSICGLMLFQGDLATKRIEVLSGGEKARVLLGKLLVQPSNLLLLDEPTNHFDMQSNEALMEALLEYKGSILLVTHNEYFLKKIATRLIIFDRGKVEFFEGNYDEFLEKRGWEEEEGAQALQKPRSTVSKKEARRLRAQVNEKRSKVLKPLGREVAKIEEKIISLESAVAEESKTLIEISQNGFGDDAAKISRSISQNKKTIEELFAELEEKSERHSKLEVELEEELKSLKA